MRVELDSEVVFLHKDEIREGIISGISETRIALNYEIEYINEESEICQVTKSSEKVFLTVNELFQSLRNDFETKKEWEE